MLVSHSVIINNRPVKKMHSFNGMEIYQEEASNDDNGARLYFTKNEKVIQIMDIEADMGQGIGYVSDINFKSEDK